MTLTFRVYGTPRPKGSVRAFVTTTPTGRPRAIVTEDNTKTRPWAALVADAARQAMTLAGWDTPLVGPVRVRLVFWLPPPKSPGII